MPVLIARPASRCDLSQCSCSFRSWIANEPLSSREISFPTYCRHEKKICWLKIQDMFSFHSAHCVICTFCLFSVCLWNKNENPPFPTLVWREFRADVTRETIYGDAERRDSAQLNPKLSATRTQFLRFFWCDENSNLRSSKPQAEATERICQGNLSSL